MKINKKFGDRIEIEWLDACGIEGWKSVNDAMKIPDEVYCFTRGWYVKHDKEFMTICRDKGKTKNNEIGGVFHIPLAWIKKIK